MWRSEEQLFKLQKYRSTSRADKHELDLDADAAVSIMEILDEESLRNLAAVSRTFAHAAHFVPSTHSCETADNLATFKGRCLDTRPFVNLRKCISQDAVIRKSQLEHLAQQFNKDYVIKGIDLSDNQITAQELNKYELWRIITDVRRMLTSLNVGGNQLNEEAALGIVRAVRQQDKTKTLGLARCRIGASGAHEVAEYMRVSSVLTSLNLLRNNLDTASANALAEVAKTKRISLCGIKPDQTEADFSWQSLGPVDAILIASDVSVSSVLTSLNLLGNQIGVEGGKAIAARYMSIAR